MLRALCYQVRFRHDVEDLDYQTYALRKRFQQFEGHIASNVSKFVKRRQSQLEEIYFYKAYPIFSLDFLKNLKTHARILDSTRRSQCD